MELQEKKQKEIELRWKREMMKQQEIEMHLKNQ